MAGCLGNDGEGSITPETLRRWTDNVNNVLATPRGRDKFRDFLSDCKMDESVCLITFWEKCHQMVPEEVKAPRSLAKKTTKKSWFFSSKKPSTSTYKACNLQNEAQEVLKYANDCEVNVDLGQLDRLSQAIEDGNHDEILCVVWEVKQEAVKLLEDNHRQFSQHLLRQRGLLGN